MGMENRIFRLPAFVLAGFEDGMIVAEMGKRICTYSYAQDVKNMLVRENLITTDIDTSLAYKKKYLLTDKGRKVREHIRIIMGVLKSGKTSVIPKER